MTTESDKINEQEKKDKPRDFFEVLSELPDAPDKTVVDGWKSKYGDVFVSPFSETEIYLFRALNRREYKALQIKQQQAGLVAQQKMQKAEKPEEMGKVIEERVDTDFAAEEELVATCLLWPKLTIEELQAKAGTVPTLNEQIMQNSNFATPQQAAVMVFKI